MRIDDENKVVWCNDNLFPLLEEEDFFEMDEFDKISYLLNLSFDKRYGIPTRVKTKKWKPILISIFDNYCYELDQPKKYYWRKKKEHLAWFEDFESVLIMSKHSKILRFGDISSYDNRYFEGRFTEQEARELLKDDFDKFEKVECD